jgi:hypothetical protein
MMQQEKWKSPYYWAAFTLQGEWKWYSEHNITFSCLYTKRASD